MFRSSDNENPNIHGKRVVGGRKASALSLNLLCHLLGEGGNGERGRERRETGREEGEEAGKDREKRKGKRNPKTPILKVFCETQMSQNAVLLKCAGMHR